MRRKGTLAATVWILAAALASPGAAAEGARRHDTAFWQGIVESDYALPRGESAAGLIVELSELLGSRDSRERDAFGYGIPARWIYVQKILAPDELREIMALWTANLRKGVGERGTDSVLLRSFSALNLSILAAHDNQSPFLEKKDFGRLLEVALDYLRDERDVRGYVEGVGWLHSTAHTADLLKFLARSRHLSRKDQERILAAIGAKMDAPGGYVYSFGEDERLARAVLSLVHREDLDRPAFQSWLEGLAGAGDGLWEGPLDLRQFARVQNTKHLLRSLFVILVRGAGAEDAPEAVEWARGRVLAALGEL